MTDPASPGQPYGGYNPYNQQGGGNPYNPQGSGNPYDPQGGEAPAPPPYGQPTPPPAKKGGAGKVIGTLVGVGALLLVLCGVGAYVFFNKVKSDTVNAKVGDCIKSEQMTSTTAKEVKNTKIVKCDSPDATYKVIGIVSGKTEVQFNIDDEICKQYPDAESALWQGQSGKAGSVLCLAPNKK